MHRIIPPNYSTRMRRLNVNPFTVFALIILIALLAFEAFNYSTTSFALEDLLGELRFMGIKWATILSIAFCGIDFAGIARMFTSQTGTEEPKEVWYLFGAWILAASMNAILTWWGVSMAIATHNLKSTAIIPDTTLLHVIPVFVALMVWVIRVLIIGAVITAGEHFLWGNRPQRSNHLQGRSIAPAANPYRPNLRPLSTRPNLSVRPDIQQDDMDEEIDSGRVEATYHRLGVTARPRNSSDNNQQIRRF